MATTNTIPRIATYDDEDDENKFAVEASILPSPIVAPPQTNVIDDDDDALAICKSKTKKFFTEVSTVFFRLFLPLRRQYADPLPQYPSRMQILRRDYLLCPPIGKLNKALTAVILAAATFGLLVAVFQKAALPGGILFSLFILIICGRLFGWFFGWIRLPPLLGMLTAGLLLHNLPVINRYVVVDSIISANIRLAAFGVILIQGGLSLDIAALQRLKGACIRLAFTPCLAEAATVGLAARFLMGLPWLHCFALGFILGAVSPAVCVPCMVKLQVQGFGVQKGIPTLVIAATSVDDVLAITGFSLLLSVILSEGSIGYIAIKGPSEVVIGILYGTIIGILLWFIPENSAKSRSINFANPRFGLLFIFGLLALFGSRAINYAGAGALGCLLTAFIAGIGWRKGTKDDHRETSDFVDIFARKTFGFLWHFVFEAALFGLIAFEIDLARIRLGTIGYGCAVLILGLMIRMAVSFVAVAGAGFTVKERIFIVFAWFPKATVQAALGTIIYDAAVQRAGGKSVDTLPTADAASIEFGLAILTVAVLSILITAPVGAILVDFTGPKLLEKSTPVDTEKGEFELK